jgi:hypothetical protein
MSKSILAICILPIISSGCLPLWAATMAPDRGMVSPDPGTERVSVIRQYGEPDSIKREGNEEVDRYESGDGPKPGERASWVAQAAFLDAFTLGVFEISAIPELVRVASGPAKYDVWAITYSPSGQVASVSRETKNAIIEPANTFRWER